MRPAFGMLRHVEQRESNAVVTERAQNSITTSVTVYSIMVTRIVIFWLTVWTHESEFTS
jgi:hypothetical protein